MQIPRIYHCDILQVKKEVCLSSSASHHIVNVLRLKKGDALVVFNGEGGQYRAEVIRCEKKKVWVTLLSFENIENESPLKIELAQGISRGERMDYTIQKAVELGVTSITPLFTERCGVKLKGDRLQKRMDHWRAVIMGACEQSGRCVLPVLNAPSQLYPWLEGVESQAKFLCDPKAELTLSACKPVESVSVLMGPEGGFSEDEFQQSLASGFVGLSLGPRILRTETAAVVSIALLQSQWGDMLGSL